MVFDKGCFFVFLILYNYNYWIFFQSKNKFLAIFYLPASNRQNQAI